jgi:hypothetical protein
MLFLSVVLMLPISTMQLNRHSLVLLSLINVFKIIVLVFVCLTIVLLVYNYKQLKIARFFFFHSKIFNFINLFSNFIKNYFYFLINNLNYKVKFNLLELVTQIYLIINFILLTIPLLNTRLLNHRILFNEIFLEDMNNGLGSIKFLLYEQNSLFLLISTFVLLVALIGAAVMTKTIKISSEIVVSTDSNKKIG